MWLACFWLLGNSCPIRVRIMHSRWRAVVLVDSPRRWLMCCSICFFLSLIYCKRPAANPKHMPGKETWKCNGTEVFLLDCFKMFAYRQEFLLLGFKDLTFPLPPNWFTLTCDERHSAFSSSIFLFLCSQWVTPVFLWLIKVYCRRSRSGLRALMKRWLTK